MLNDLNKTTSKLYQQTVRRNQLTRGKKLCAEIIYIVLQTSVQLFFKNIFSPCTLSWTNQQTKMSTSNRTSAGLTANGWDQQ